MRVWGLLLLAVSVSGLALKSQTDTAIFTSTSNATVPCTLCAAAMPEFLDFCRLHNGFSLPSLSDFVNQCAQIGEDDFIARDARTGCGKETVLLRSRFRVLNRKIRCLKIYEGLSATYKPFDPCTQIRKVVEEAPMAVCQGPIIRCIPPPTEEDVPFLPSSINGSLPFEFPPLKCPQYVSRLVAECSTVKQNFYARSNLEQMCPVLFGDNTHQVAGCEVVRQKMVDQDFTMDLCSSLSAKPIVELYTHYCETKLALTPLDPVPVASYAVYIERVKIYKQLYTLGVRPPANVQLIGTHVFEGNVEKVVSPQEPENKPDAPPIEVTHNV